MNLLFTIHCGSLSLTILNKIKQLLNKYKGELPIDVIGRKLSNLTIKQKKAMRWMKYFHDEENLRVLNALIVRKKDKYILISRSSF